MCERTSLTVDLVYRHQKALVAWCVKVVELYKISFLSYAVTLLIDSPGSMKCLKNVENTIFKLNCDVLYRRSTTFNELQYTTTSNCASFILGQCSGMNECAAPSKNIHNASL